MLWVSVDIYTYSDTARLYKRIYIKGLNITVNTHVTKYGSCWYRFGKMTRFTQK